MEINEKCQLTSMNDEFIYEISDFFKIFGDSSRLKILCSLDNQEKTVSEIANELNMSLSAVSHQLKILKMNKVVTFKRSGKNIYYLLGDEHISSLIKIAKIHLEEEK